MIAQLSILLPTSLSACVHFLSGCKVPSIIMPASGSNVFWFFFFFFCLNWIRMNWNELEKGKWKGHVDVWKQYTWLHLKAIVNVCCSKFSNWGRAHRVQAQDLTRLKLLGEWLLLMTSSFTTCCPNVTGIKSVDPWGALWIFNIEMKEIRCEISYSLHR